MTASPPDDFAGFGLAAPLLDALERAGHARPTPIQSRAIPPLMAGRDVVVMSQTGSGKTAAYALPLLHRLATDSAPRRPGAPRALILAPTRELASQIAGVCRTLGRALPLRTRIACGGLPREGQIKALEDGADLLVATPGRLVELLEGGHLVLDDVRTLVLDEADRLIEGDLLVAMGRIAPYLPERRQTVLCSATQPPVLRDLAGRLLHSPERIEIEAPTVTPRRIRQRVIFAQREEKPELVARAAADFQHESSGRDSPGRIIAFVRTRAEAEKFAAILRRAGIPCETLHGDKTQGARSKALDAVRQGRARVLVATDLAARGLDLDSIGLIINTDVPDAPETYIHRIGRTARAGKSGAALTLCAPEERTALRRIEQQIGYRITVTEP